MKQNIIVIGGGPGGSTAAALLAKQGFDVLVIEREKFPRYHIGESLVPGIWPIIEELGLREELMRANHTVKEGITLRWGAKREPWSVTFGETGVYPHAFQVERAHFDHMLLRNARRSGAMVLEETSVTEVLFEDGRCCGVRYATRGGTPVTARANWVIDASGQTGVLARALDLREYDPVLKNIAIWGYFERAEFYTGSREGNILIENMPDGWLWVIPLRDGTCSVGWVSPVNVVKASGADLEELIMRRIRESVECARILRNAKRVSALHTCKDWSYRSKCFQGPGFALTGDAAGFVDPLFSTGVFLAMNAGSLVAKCLGQALRVPESAAQHMAHYEEVYRGFLEVVFSFVHYFYDASRDKEAYWSEAQRIMDPISRMNRRKDFVYLISGLGGVHSVMGLEPDVALARLKQQSMNTDAGVHDDRLDMLDMLDMACQGPSDTAMMGGAQ
jgi:halogenation protein CepH